MHQLAAFFDAWGLSDPAERRAIIEDTFTEGGTYADPRSNGVLTGAEAIASYVDAFSQNAPGWTAVVVKSDTTPPYARATVAFGGTGPDGTEMVQHGQYFARLDGNRIAEIVGFVGLGTPE